MRYAVLCSVLFINLLPFQVWGQGRDAKAMSSDWSEFVSSFMTADGRVIDWQNYETSHSEGQGYAMIAAVFFNDRHVFDKLYTWSDNNLGRGLRAWKWGKGDNGWHILDGNNATDGDILHAWALFLAGERWNEPRYTSAAADIAGQIRNRLITKDGLLLPGLHGFIDNEGVTINPSYYIFPALKDFIKFDADHAALWEHVYAGGLEIIKKSGQKHLGFVPDWVHCGPQGEVLPTKTAAQFGYEAIRIPLYLSLANEKEAARLFMPLVLQVAKAGRMNAIYNLDGSSPGSSVEAVAGYYAVLARTASLLEMTDTADTLWRLAEEKKQAQRGNYYGTVLYLMALLRQGD